MGEFNGGESYQGSGEGIKSLYEAPIELHEILEDYKPEVIDAVRYKYAQTVLSTKDEDNLQWAKDFMDGYERKHKNTKDRK